MLACSEAFRLCSNKEVTTFPKLNVVTFDIENDGAYHSISILRSMVPKRFKFIIYIISKLKVVRLILEVGQLPKRNVVEFKWNPDFVFRSMCRAYLRRLILLQ